MAVHLTILVLILFAIYFAYPFKTLFVWHPLLMLVGLYGFSLQGIIVYNKFSSLVPTANAIKKYNLHALLQTLGIIVIIAGSAVIDKVKRDNNRPRLKSWHGILGILFIFHGLLQVIFGFLKSCGFMKRWMKPSISRKMHAISGAIFFSLGCLVTGLGFRSEWFQQRALVDSIQDQGVRMLVDYILILLLCLLFIIVSTQIYDRYFAGHYAPVTNTPPQVKNAEKSR
ncbi:unnamed protein product [Rodentolepis nana]|uniref:ascorbate ferrireductase (transmembrane) n=1 Tax=Rodentolepis nana TaxID=102285 RepID=A0A0R3TTN2_RODNA|nr:unnamed protein product [Rodentolepis nana]